MFNTKQAASFAMHDAGLTESEAQREAQNFASNLSSTRRCDKCSDKTKREDDIYCQECTEVFNEELSES